MIGAFRGLSLLFLGFAASVELVLVVEVVVCDPAVALLFCASSSPSAILGGLSFLCHGAVGGHVCCVLPEMLVSGDPLFFGGGNSEPSVWGRCADSVIKGRLEDAARDWKDVKGHRWALRQCAHRRVAAGCAVKRKMVEIEGADVLSEAMAVCGVQEVYDGRGRRVVGVVVMLS